MLNASWNPRFVRFGTYVIAMSSHSIPSCAGRPVDPSVPGSNSASNRNAPDGVQRLLSRKPDAWKTALEFASAAYSPSAEWRPPLRSAPPAGNPFVKSQTFASPHGFAHDCGVIGSYFTLGSRSMAGAAPLSST